MYCSPSIEGKYNRMKRQQICMTLQNHSCTKHTRCSVSAAPGTSKSTFSNYVRKLSLFLSLDWYDLSTLSRLVDVVRWRGQVSSCLRGSWTDTELRTCNQLTERICSLHGSSAALLAALVSSDETSPQACLRLYFAQ